MLPPAAVRPSLRIAGRWAFSPRATWEQRRRRMEAACRTPGPPRGTTVDHTVLGGIPCERLTPPGAGAGTLLYLHGGGYAVGSALAYRGLAGRLAKALGAPAVVPDYRLAPEHPHPAGLEDSVAVYEALLAQGAAPASIALAGDSAGAGLALALAMSLRDAGRPLPAAVGLICPWVDLRPDLAGTRAPAPREPVLTRGMVRQYARAYLAGGARPDDPLVSPVLGDLSGLPPIVVHSAGDDLLAADAGALEAAAVQAGAPLEHRRLERVWHDVHIQAPLLSGIGDPIGELAASLRAPMARA